MVNRLNSLIAGVGQDSAQAPGVQHINVIAVQIHSSNL